MKTKEEIKQLAKINYFGGKDMFKEVDKQVTSNDKQSF